MFLILLQHEITQRDPWTWPSRRNQCSIKTEADLNICQHLYLSLDRCCDWTHLNFFMFVLMFFCWFDQMNLWSFTRCNVHGEPPRASYRLLVHSVYYYWIKIHRHKCLTFESISTSRPSASTRERQKNLRFTGQNTEHLCTFLFCSWKNEVIAVTVVSNHTFLSQLLRKALQSIFSSQVKLWKTKHRHLQLLIVLFLFFATICQTWLISDLLSATFDLQPRCTLIIGNPSRSFSMADINITTSRL